MFVNNIYIEILKFGDFNFGDFFKIAQNYIPAKK